jgi:hypothetical protein
LRCDRLTAGQVAISVVSRLELKDRVFLTPGTFERPNWRIHVPIRKNVHEAHWAAARGTFRGQTVDVR